MHIVPDFLLVGLLSPKTFTLRNMPPTLSFCAEPKGEVAESIIRKLTLSFLDRGDLLPREKVFLCFLKMWILQLRASPPNRMTWEWGYMRKEESSSLSEQLQTAPKEQTA